MFFIVGITPELAVARDQVDRVGDAGDPPVFLDFNHALFEQPLPPACPDDGFPFGLCYFTRLSREEVYFRCARMMASRSVSVTAKSFILRQSNIPGRRPTFYFTGTVAGAPFCFTKNTRNLAGFVLLAFLETV